MTREGVRIVSCDARVFDPTEEMYHRRVLMEVEYIKDDGLLPLAE